MKSKYLMIGAAVCAALFLFSGIMLCRQYADEKQSAEAFEQVAALVETESAPADTPQETEPLSELAAFEKYRAVQEQNSDFVGWLSIPGTNIDYPVMQTVNEPNFYLKRGFDKQYSDYGVPYVQENCDLALSDNCVIYGHHMNNGTMFADLCKYESEASIRSTRPSALIRCPALVNMRSWRCSRRSPIPSRASSIITSPVRNRRRILMPISSNARLFPSTTPALRQNTTTS